MKLQERSQPGPQECAGDWGRGEGDGKWREVLQMQEVWPDCEWGCGAGGEEERWGRQE
jgi:hypothetical protein